MKKIEAIKENYRISNLTEFAPGMYCGCITLPDKKGTWTGSVVFGYEEEGWEHVSVAPFEKKRTPTWDDMTRIKEIFFEDEEEAIQICLHLWRPATIKAVQDIAKKQGLQFST